MSMLVMSCDRAENITTRPSDSVQSVITIDIYLHRTWGLWVLLSGSCT